MEKLSKCCDKYFILGVPKSSSYHINHVTLHEQYKPILSLYRYQEMGIKMELILLYW